MAAYFHETQPEISTGSDGGLQTLVLMNPGANYIQFSDHQNHNNGNFVFLDPHAPPPTTTQQFVGIPLSNHPPPDPTDSNHHHNNNNISVAALHGFVPTQRVHYNLYNTDEGTPRAQQGLSLTLSSQQQQHQQQVAQTNLGFGSGADGIRVGSGSTGGSGVSHGVSALLGSKYLKAAQELLDEVVNVNNHHFHDGSKKETSTNKLIGEFSGRDGSPGGEAVAARKRSAELTTAERQEIQMKKAKLLSMLDEVEQRYRQYHRQMQQVISSFEQAAGMGSARTYTSLALKTISKQFRCLKDAITGQIRAANKSLREEDSSSAAGKMEGSRLKFVDNQLRQQRALQQLGMMQHHHHGNAWRPQRGLPERAVSVLRAWLFEHFLHPYPKDSDKHMLAKQTGLTRSQVSNWFINARVRLWKPMVEEMYLEEMKEQDKNNVSSDKTEQNKEDSASKSTGNQEKSPATENRVLNVHNTPSISTVVSRNPTGFSLIGSSELDGITQGSPKKPRTNHEMLQSPLINMEFNNSNANSNFMGSFGVQQYSLGEITRFEAESFGTPRFSGNNGVSLTLGLPHCETLPVAHQSFLPNQNITTQLGRRLEMAEPDEFGGMNQSSSTPHSSSSAYDSINIQNQRRFVAQLLPDFVT